MSIHKAEPDGTLSRRCVTCGQRVHAVPGGNGTTWVHTDSGAVVATDPPQRDVLDAIEAATWGPAPGHEHDDSNDRRADLAWVALRAFEKACMSKPDNEDYQTILQDLLCDLIHLCRRERLDWNLAIMRASDMHDDEEIECDDEFELIGIGPSEHRELTELANGEIEMPCCCDTNPGECPVREPQEETP